MPTFTSKKKFADGLLNMEHEGDKTIFTHCHNITPYLQNAYDERNSGHDGYNEDRTQRKIASLPPGEEARLRAEWPEVFTDMREMRKYLNSPEGKRFLTVRSI